MTNNLDQRVLTRSTPRKGINTVTYTDGTPTAAELLPKIYDGIQKVASNRFRQPNVVVMHPRRAAWLGKELSSTFPLFQQGTLTQAIGEQDGGFTTSFGGLRVVLDPTSPRRSRRLRTRSTSSTSTI
jgi:hypothetical protein